MAVNARKRKAKEPQVTHCSDVQQLIDMYTTIHVAESPNTIITVDGGERRLIITKLVVENFKSYGARVELKNLCKNFNCIIGDNGCGKSNVIDALLFVFGYRSTRIRCKKMSELIHNSPLLMNVSFCRVEVHFALILDDTEYSQEHDVINGSEFTIARTARRDNTSTYYINDEVVSHADIIQCLSKHGIDMKHNRFLILQGEVEQIALMPPKATSSNEDGLLEYLEDIIGSSRFKGPLKTLEMRIDHLNEVRREKMTRLKVQENEIKSYEGLRNQALEYLRSCNKLVLMKNVFYQKCWWQRKTLEDAAIAEKDKAEEFMESLRSAKKALSEKEVRLSKELQSIQKRCSMCTLKLQEHKEAYNQAEIDDVSLRDEYKHSRSKVASLKKTISQVNKKLEEMQSLPDNSEMSLQKIEKHLQRLHIEKNHEEIKYQHAFDNLQNVTEPFSLAKEAKERELNALQIVVNNESQKMEIAKSRLEILCSGHRKATARCELFKETWKQLQEKLAFKEEEFKTVQLNLANEMQTLDEHVKELNSIRESENEMRDQYNAKQIEVTQIRDVAKMWESGHKNNLILTSLMEQRRLGRIPGILGRLGDLGTIDPMYDVAVSTSCSAMDNIVVDTMDTAQACVLFLKREVLGEATFIALDKMEIWREPMERSPNLPRGSIRLFDVFRIADRRFRTAFYYAARDTLVAKDSNEATRLAFSGSQRHRVVSLSGMLIDTSGSVSGGGRQTKCGKMRLTTEVISQKMGMLARPSDVADLESQLRVITGEYKILQEKRALGEMKLTQMKRVKEHLENQISNLQVEILQLRQDIPTAFNNYKAAEKMMYSSIPKKEELSRLQSVVLTCEKSHNTAMENAAQAKLQVDGIQKQIQEKWDTLLCIPKRSMEAVEASIREVVEKKVKLVANVKSIQRNLGKLEEQKSALAKEYAEEHARLEDMQKKLDRLASLATKHAQSCKVAEAELNQVKEKMAEKTSEMESLTTESNELNRKISQAKQSLQEMMTKVESASQETRFWKKKLAALKLTALVDNEGSPKKRKKRSQENEDNPASTFDDLDMEEEEEDSSKPCGSKRNTSSKSLQSFIKQHCSLTHGQEDLPHFSKEQLEDVIVEEEELNKLDSDLESVRPNLGAIEVYRLKELAYLQRLSDAKSLDVLRTEQLTMQSEFRKERLREFLFGFQQISDGLKRMYQAITNGGDAELELVDSLDPFSEGVVFSVRPPDKSWKLISNLSGGEKTLSSLALVFSLHHYRPTPLYVMDEVDAALDYRNTSVVAHYLERRTKNAQFVIISLRPYMFEKAHHVVGVLKKYYCSTFSEFEPRRGVQSSLTEQISRLPNQSIFKHPSNCKFGVSSNSITQTIPILEKFNNSMSIFPSYQESPFEVKIEDISIFYNSHMQPMLYNESGIKDFYSPNPKPLVHVEDIGCPSIYDDEADPPVLERETDENPQC